MAKLSEATRVGGVHLQVATLERSSAYYRDVIGLQLLGQGADHVTLGAPGSNEPLVTLHAVPGTLTALNRGTFGLFHFALLLPDRPSLGRFLAHLAARGERPGMADHLVSEALYLYDPDGLGIEVYADRQRTAWTYRGGQLQMATDPLDVQGVLAAGAGAPWRGVPAGTTMGHMHLHVGNLNEAAAFYQRLIGFEVTVSTYPGALFMSAGGYHHHLGTNTWAPGPAPTPNQARLLEWTLVVPSPTDAAAIGQRLEHSGAAVRRDGSEWIAVDPWGTPVRIAAQ